jgi:uncharacterized membrane protein YdjX (TVP38/TMEM64 family)
MPDQDKPMQTAEINANTKRSGSSPIKKFLPLALLVAGFAGFFILGGGDYLSLQKLADNRDALQTWATESLVLVGGAYMLLYITVIAFSLPVGTVLTLAGGFIFGTLIGGALTVVGATIGATLLFIAARTAFAEYFQERMGDTVAKMRQRFEDNAFSYILALRLAPIFPFVVVNVAPALAGAPLRTYVAATAIGIIPGTFVYASVGAGLDAIFAEGGMPNLGAVFQWDVLLPLVLLALLALAPTLWKALKGK